MRWLGEAAVSSQLWIKPEVHRTCEWRVHQDTCRSFQSLLGKVSPLALRSSPGTAVSRNLCQGLLADEHSETSLLEALALVSRRKSQLNKHFQSFWGCPQRPVLVVTPGWDLGCVWAECLHPPSTEQSQMFAFPLSCCLPRLISSLVYLKWEMWWGFCGEYSEHALSWGHRRRFK